MDQFNEVYKPDATDINAKLLFHKKGTKEIDVSVGNLASLRFHFK